MDDGRAGWPGLMFRRFQFKPRQIQTSRESSLTPACGCHFTGHDADPETQASPEELHRRVHRHFRSRGQLNIAVSVAYCIVGHMPWRKWLASTWAASAPAA